MNSAAFSTSVRRLVSNSAVAAALIHRAIGDQLTCVFVDHGLLRLNEATQVRDTFAKHMHVKVIHVDASADFMQALKGTGPCRWARTGAVASFLPSLAPGD